MNPNQVARLGMLIGDPARATMLLALMDGRALTAGELARAARITPQTASAHLAQLVDAGLLSVQKQGRHRYHRIASAQTARLLESIEQHASDGVQAPRTVVTGPKDVAMRRARTCYDHFAGQLGVAIADALQKRGMVEFDDDSGVITSKGMKHLVKHGVLSASDKTGQGAGPRLLCRPCLDWSERRHHVAGRLGAAICNHFVEHGHVRRQRGGRALQVTASGHQALNTIFGVRRFGD